MISERQKFVEDDINRILPLVIDKFDDLRNKSLLITGAGGFLGSWLIQLINFLNNSHNFSIQLFLIDRDFSNLKQNNPNILNFKNIFVIETDIRSSINLSNSIDYIIHAASTPDRRMHSSSPLDTMRSISEGTSSILHVASRLPNLKMLLNMSASSIYDQSDMTSIDENSCGKSLSQNVIYAHSEAKRFAEMLCTAARNEARIPVTTLRPFTFCGPYQDIDSPWAINNFIKNAINKSPIKILGNGETIRSYMYGLDFAIWTIVIMLNTKAGEIYNIGSNDGIFLHDLAKKISANFNHSIEIKTNKSLIGEIKTDSLLPNINKACDHFELEIYTEIDEAIKRTIEWYSI
jgi:nucleoside-diphosphate-sugar epimerase